MDYKTVAAMLTTGEDKLVPGQEDPNLTDYDAMVSNRRAKTQAELAGLNEMQALVDYTTPPQLRAAKMADIEGRREAISRERQQLETDEEFLRRYAASRGQGIYEPAPTAGRDMEAYIAPTAKDMISQPSLSDQTFQPQPIQNTASFELDPFDPTMGAGRAFLEPIKEFSVGVPRGAANMVASMPAIAGAGQAASNREAISYLDQAETSLRRMAELKQQGMDEFEFIQQASDMIEGAPQAIRYKISQAVGNINAGDDPQTVIAKFREDMEALPLETKETGSFKLAEAMHAKINEALPVAEGYEDAWSTKIGEGAGSLVPMVGAAMIPGVGLPMALGTGMASQGGAAVEEAVKDKASEDDILKYGLAGTAIGSLEALPVGKLVGKGAGLVGGSLGLLEKAAPQTMAKVTDLVTKLSPAAQSKFAKIAGQLAGQAVEEGAQEGLSQTLLNVAGQLTYDENRDTFKGVPEAVAIGAIVGGGVKGVQLGIGAALDEKEQPAATTLPPETKPTDIVGDSGGPDLGPTGLGGREGEILRGEADYADPIAGTFDPFTIDGERATFDAPATRATGLGGLEGEIMDKDRAPARAEPIRGTLESPVVEGEVNRAQIEGTRELPGSTEDYAVIDDGLGDLIDYARKTKPSAPLRIEKREDLVEAAADVREPTEAQKQAGNYRKGHMKVDGLDITIETPKGAERKGVDPTGQEWSVTMPGHYGYIKRSTGMDGDHVDVTVGDDIDSKKVFVIDQVNADTKEPDEHKVIMGVASKEAAAELYRQQFSDGRGDERMGAMVELDGDAFKGWLKNGDTKAPIASQMPDKVTAKPSLEELFAEQKKKTEARRATSSALAAEGKPVKLDGKDGRTAMAGPDMSEPGKYRLTRFDDRGPSGHTVYNTLEEAIDDGLREGYVPAKAAQQQAKGFRDEASTTQTSNAPYKPLTKEGDGTLYDGDDMQITKSGEEFVAKIDGKPVARMSLSWRGPYATSIEVEGQHRRKGLATKLYDTVEAFIGRKMIPSPLGTSDDANKLWKRRLSGLSPEEKQALLQEAVDIGRDAGVGKSTLERMQKLGYQMPVEDAKNAPSDLKDKNNVKSDAGTEGLRPGVGQPGSDRPSQGAGDQRRATAEGSVRDGEGRAGGAGRGVQNPSPKAADARGRNRGRQPESVRRFAETAEDGTKSLKLTHFGNKFHSVLKPSDGWNTRGSEKERAAHPDFVPRTYYGIGTGKEGGYVKEVAGKFGHVTSIDPDDLYDFATDPDKLNPGKGMASYEKAIKDAGYAGYVNLIGMKGEFGPAAVVFYDAKAEEHFDDGIDDPKDLPRAKGLEKTVKLGDTKKRLFVGPVKRAREAKAAYARSSKIKPATHIREYVKVDEERAKRIAQAFDEMKHDPNDPQVKAAYKAMINETLDQYQAMLDAGFKAELMTPGMADPYPESPRLAIEDIRDNNHMWVFPTDDGFGSSDLDVSDNPLLAETSFKDINGRVMLANDVFRAVHDYFGHAVEGNGMRARGEEMAWRVHASMYSPLARRAMTTETRGQNSWVNYGPNAEHNKTASGADTIYAPQKIGLLPEWASSEGLHDPTHLKNIEKHKTMARGRGPVEVKQDNVKKPDSLIEFVAKNGGIKEQTGELKAIGLTNRKTGFVSGAGPVVRAAGKPADRVREMAEQAGYLREGSTIADLFNALEEDARSGRTLFSRQDDEQASRWRESVDRDNTYSDIADTYKLAPGFYSALTKGIETAKQKQAPAKDWKSIIAALPGVRKAEIDWIDVNGWLDYQTGQVTREDLVNFVKANEIEINEVILTKGGALDTRGDAIVDELGRFTFEIDESTDIDPSDDYLNDLADNYLDEAGAELEENLDEDEELDPDKVRERAKEIAERYYYQSPDRQGDITISFADGTSAGFTYSEDEGGIWFDGENYDDRGELQSAVQAKAEAMAEEKGLEESDVDYGTQYDSYVEKGGTNYREILLTIPGLEEKGTNATHRIDPNFHPVDKEAYESSHFDKTPNIIVHARTTDRQRGEVLFIEEVQSDLGSDLRKGGEPPTEADFERWKKLNDAVEEAYQTQLDAEVALELKFEEHFADEIEATKADTSAKQRSMKGERYAPMELFMRDLNKGLGHFWAETLGAKESISDDDLLYVQIPYQSNIDSEDLKAIHPYARWLKENAADELKAVVDTAKARDDAKLRVAEMKNPNEYRPSSLPNFPFEGESYYHLAMKRMLRLAVDEGKKAIAWTPAYMQGRRWSYAVQNVVKSVHWGETYDTGREVELRGVNGIDVIKVDQNGVMEWAKGGKIRTDDVKGKKLSELIGKPIADQVMGSREGSVRDQQIVVGGEGYTIAYDRHIKNFMEKFAKKYGSSVTVDKGLVGYEPSDTGKLLTAYIMDPNTKVSEVFDHAVSSPNVNPAEFRKAVDDEMDRLKGKAEEAVSVAEGHLRDIRREFSEFVFKHGEGDMMESKFLDDIKAQEDAVKATTITYEEFVNKRGPEYAKYQKRVIINTLRAVLTEQGALNHMKSKVALNGDPVWKVEITDKMRDAILEGQPFSIGRSDYQITPEAQNKIDDLLATIRKVAPGLKVRMEMSIDDNKNIWGKYSRDNGAITIAAIALDVGRGKQVFGHEALHAFVDHGLLTPAEIEILQRYSEQNDLIGKYGLREQYEKAYGARGLSPADYQRMLNEEGLAELVGEMIGNPETKIPGELKGIIGKLKRLLERIANAVRGLGFQTSTDILKKISSGEVGQRSFDGFVPKSGELYSLGHDRVTSIKRTTANDLGDFLVTDNKIIHRARAAQRYLQDKFLSVKLMQRALADQILDDENAYLSEELSAARIPEQTQEMNDKMQDILVDLHEAGIDRDLFERFLRMRHAKERNENIAKINTKFKDGGSGTKTKAAERWLRLANKLIPADKMQAMKAAASKVYALNREALKVRLDGGLIDQAYYNELVNQYRYYVPLKGHEFMEDLKPIGTNRGYGARGSGLKQAMGRRSEAQNTLSYVVEDFRRAIYSAERNKVNIALFNFIKNNTKKKADGTDAKADYFELDPIRYKRILVKKRGLYQGRKIWVPADFVGDNAKIAAYLQGLEGNASERLRLDPTPAHNDLPVMIGGKRHIMRVKNDTLLNDLLDMHTNIERIPFFSAAMSGFTRMLTMWNPAFGPTNFVRDVMGVGLTTGSELGAKEAAKIMTSAFRMTRIILKSVRGKTSSDPETLRLLDLYKEMKLAGGSTGFSHVVRDAETIQRELEQEAQWLTGNRSMTQRMKHGIIALDRFMEKFNRVFEDATRLAAYENRLKAGDTQKQALSYAKNVTVNFNKRGHQAGFSQWYAFANANFQGNYRMLRAFINGKNGGKVLGGLVMGGFLYGLANILMGYDDDEPEKINSWYERNQYDKAFYIMLGPIKLPKPHGFMIPFDIGTKMAELLMATIDPEHCNPSRRTPADLTASAVAEVGAGLTSFVPIGTQEDTILRFFPTLTAPIASAALNMSPFGGSIYPEGFDRTKPNWKQFYAETPEIYHSTAKWLNTLSGGDEFQSGYVDVSPEVIEFIVNSYLGGTGGEIRKTASLAMTGIDAALGNETKPIRTEDIPIIRRFLSSQRTNALTDYYYEFSDRMQTVKSAMSEAKDGSETARQFVKEHEVERQMMAQWEATKKQRTALRKKIDELDEDRRDGANVGLRRDVLITKRALIERRFARTFQIEDQIAELKKQGQTKAVQVAIEKLRRDKAVMSTNIAKLLADQDQMIASRATDSGRINTLGGMFR